MAAKSKLKVGGISLKSKAGSTGKSKPRRKKDPLNNIPERNHAMAVDENSANEIRSQSLQDFTVHGRAHGQVMAELESNANYFTGGLKAVVLKTIDEVGAIESQSVGHILVDKNGKVVS